jgi:hypothetical protein
VKAADEHGLPVDLLAHLCMATLAISWRFRRRSVISATVSQARAVLTAANLSQREEARQVDLQGRCVFSTFPGEFQSIQPSTWLLFRDIGVHQPGR